MANRLSSVYPFSIQLKTRDKQLKKLRQTKIFHKQITKSFRDETVNRNEKSSYMIPSTKISNSVAGIGKHYKSPREYLSGIMKLEYQ